MADIAPIFNDDLIAVCGVDGTTQASGANPFPISGPLTDAQLRATPVPVTGPLTDAQLRATSVPVIANAGTNLNTSALNLEATQAIVKTNTDNLNLSQESTTAGQKGNLILGAVTTSAPTYTTAKSDPFSLKTNGDLRVNDADAITVLNAIAAALGVTTAAILIQNEIPGPSTRNETDFTGMTYTVPTGKKFLLTSFMGSYDAQSTIHLRFKKQTAGAGAWNQLFRITLEVGGQGQSTVPLNFGNGIYIGNATDKFKVTVEASIANKGTVWSCFTGAEI
jgi:hypothetical protein